MKRNGIVLIAALGTLFLAGQVFADVISFSANCPQASGGQIPGKAPFAIELYIENQSSTTDWTGGGYVFGFSSPDGSITDYTHINKGIPGKTSTRCVMLINFWDAYMDAGAFLPVEFSWDASLPDTLSAASAGTVGLTAGVGDYFIQFNFQVDYKEAGFDNGTFCIDSVGLPPAQSDFDWLFAAPFEAVWAPGAPLCWTITGLDLGVTQTNSPDKQLPTDFGLTQNYPNPFNPATKFDFALPTMSHVKIEVFNVLGQKGKTLADAEYGAGYYTVDWDGSTDTGGFAATGI